MNPYDLLLESLPYLTTLLNIHVCRAEPCMDQENEEKLRKLIDQIWEILKQKDDF